MVTYCWRRTKFGVSQSIQICFHIFNKYVIFSCFTFFDPGLVESQAFLKVCLEATLSTQEAGSSPCGTVHSVEHLGVIVLKFSFHPG